MNNETVLLNNEIVQLKKEISILRSYIIDLLKCQNHLIEELNTIKVKALQDSIKRTKVNLEKMNEMK